MKGKTIVLGVSGGIAAYKAAALCSKLVQAGANVRVVMTEGASKFVTPLTFQAISRNPVFVDTFDEKDASVIAHIDLADHADLIVVAPATANVIAKMAHGIADDMLTTVLLAAACPVLIAPAMNVHMLEHPAVQANLATLAARGIRFAEPGVGQLACGYVGKGRLEEPELIAERIRELLMERDERPLDGCSVLVSVGATAERIDPVRVLTNDSSGKMGFAVAEQALRLGARSVTAVCGLTTAPVPAGIELVRVESALEMQRELEARYDGADLVVMAAAVADYRPAERSERKLKKVEGVQELTLRLVKNPDILAGLGAKRTKQFLVGFAAETEELESNAMKKLAAKRCNLIVANDVTDPQAGFGKDTNVLHIYGREGLVCALPPLAKAEAARELLKLAAECMREEQGEGQ